MIEIVKRIGEFSKEYNRLMGLFCKITPTTKKNIRVRKTRSLEEIAGTDLDEVYYENKLGLCNSGSNLITDGVGFPKSQVFKEKAKNFYEDCDTLILYKQDSRLRDLLGLFKPNDIYPNTDQFVNAGMYDEMELLNLLDDVYRYAKNLSYIGFCGDRIAERREFLLSQKKESSYDMESTNVSKQDNSKQERTEGKRSVNEQGEIILPPEFDTEMAKGLFRKVQEKELCDDRFDWKGSKTLFAYFASKASDTLGLSNRMAGERKAVSWKPFETLFTIKGKHISGLAQALQDLEKVGEVKGQKDIDSLF